MDHFNIFKWLGGCDGRGNTPRVSLPDCKLGSSNSLSVSYGLDRFKLRGWRR
jgi:hypothetical protein